MRIGEIIDKCLYIFPPLHVLVRTKQEAREGEQQLQCRCFAPLTMWTYFSLFTTELVPGSKLPQGYGWSTCAPEDSAVDCWTQSDT